MLITAVIAIGVLAVLETPLWLLGSVDSGLLQQRSRVYSFRALCFQLLPLTPRGSLGNPRDPRVVCSSFWGFVGRNGSPRGIPGAPRDVGKFRNSLYYFGV